MGNAAAGIGVHLTIPCNSKVLMHLEVAVSLASDSSKPVVSAPTTLNLLGMLSGLCHLALEIRECLQRQEVLVGLPKVVAIHCNKCAKQ